MRLFRFGRDPFWDDGVGARQAHHRERIEGFIALALAIGACGLTVAAVAADPRHVDRVRAGLTHPSLAA